MERRNFIKKISTGTAALAIGGAGVGLNAKTYSQVIGANSRINVAVIGVRSHGRTHISAYKKMPDDVRIAALCDCDSAILNRELSLLEKDNIKAKGYIDLRKLYDDKDIDAVSIVTPNYWHALATVWACQAGKHVCVEKPVSHSIWEGRKMVEAARKYKRLVQADLDCRSDVNLAAGIAYMQKNLGKVQYVRVVNYKRRKSIGKIMGPGNIPDTVDYDLFTGPVPMMPLPRQELHYDWHWQWLTGNCEIGNNGPHQLDMCRWALGKSTLPKTVLSFGGRFGYVDDGNVPNTQVAWYDYDGIPVLYDSRALGEKTGIDNMDGFTGATATGKKVHHPYRGEANCDIFIFCENGYLNMDKVYDNDGKLVKHFQETGTKGPQFSFINALKSGKKEDLRTDILEGHLSTAICHIGNIAYQTGKRTSLDELKKTVEQYKYLKDVFTGFEEHLRANGINVAKEELYLGEPLTFDSAAEKFVDTHSAIANRFLKDSYREPFVIPENV